MADRSAYMAPGGSGGGSYGGSSGGGGGSGYQREEYAFGSPSSGGNVSGPEQSIIYTHSTQCDGDGIAAAGAGSFDLSGGGGSYGGSSGGGGTGGNSTAPDSNNNGAGATPGVTKPRADVSCYLGPK